jgi:tRNA(Ile)-lysidine synthase
MALAVLARAAAAAPVLALTVDHGLRPESAAEAAMVHTWLSALGIPHRVLPIAWGPRGVPPPGAADVQARARAARYATLVAAAEAAGCQALLVGQHADDQSETLLMRLGMGSGLDGLAGTRPAVAPPDLPASHVRILRPLLNIPKVLSSTD